MLLVSRFFILLFRLYSAYTIDKVQYDCTKLKFVIVLSRPIMLPLNKCLNHHYLPTLLLEKIIWNLSKVLSSNFFRSAKLSPINMTGPGSGQMKMWNLL